MKYAEGARAPRVLMLGTDPEGHGGVATVVSLLRQGGLFEREGVRYVQTHADGSRVRKAAVFCMGLWRTLAVLARDPSLVHAHAASRGSFVRKSLLLALARKRGCKTVFHLHGACFDAFVAASSGPMRRWIRHTLERSSAVIALSLRWADFLRTVAPEARVLVIPNAVPLPALDSQQPQPGRILFLGQVEPRKGVFELLGALALLRERFPQAELVVGGKGQLDELKRRAEELGVAQHVILLGWISGARKQEELARAAVFCLPSHAEGLPMALLEAMAAGKAVVVTGVGGMPDAVQDGDNGLIVPAGDASALARALGRILADEEEGRRLGMRARATIERRFAPGIVHARLSALYQQLRDNIQ